MNFTKIIVNFELDLEKNLKGCMYSAFLSVRSLEMKSKTIEMYF